MSALLARNWWAIAPRGVLAILFGLLALLLSLATLQVLVLLFAAYMLRRPGNRGVCRSCLREPLRSCPWERRSARA